MSLIQLVKNDCLKIFIILGMSLAMINSTNFTYSPTDTSNSLFNAKPNGEKTNEPLSISPEELIPFSGKSILKLKNGEFQEVSVLGLIYNSKTEKFIYSSSKTSGFISKGDLILQAGPKVNVLIPLLAGDLVDSVQTEEVSLEDFLKNVGTVTTENAEELAQMGIDFNTLPMISYKEEDDFSKFLNKLNSNFAILKENPEITAFDFTQGVEKNNGQILEEIRNEACNNSAKLSGLESFKMVVDPGVWPGVQGPAESLMKKLNDSLNFLPKASSQELFYEHTSINRAMVANMYMKLLSQNQKNILFIMYEYMLENYPKFLEPETRMCNTPTFLFDSFVTFTFKSTNIDKGSLVKFDDTIKDYKNKLNSFFQKFEEITHIENDNYTYGILKNSFTDSVLNLVNQNVFQIENDLKIKFKKLMAKYLEKTQQLFALRIINEENNDNIDHVNMLSYFAHFKPVQAKLYDSYASFKGILNENRRRELI